MFSAICHYDIILDYVFCLPMSLLTVPLHSDKVNSVGAGLYQCHALPCAQRLKQCPGHGSCVQCLKVKGMALLKILHLLGPQHSHLQNARSTSLPESPSGSTYSTIFQGTPHNRSPAVSETEGQTVTCLPVTLRTI